MDESSPPPPRDSMHSKSRPSPSIPSDESSASIDEISRDKELSPLDKAVTSVPMVANILLAAELATLLLGLLVPVSGLLSFPLLIMLGLWMVAIGAHICKEGFVQGLFSFTGAFSICLGLSPLALLFVTFVFLALDADEMAVPIAIVIYTPFFIPAVLWLRARALRHLGKKILHLPTHVVELWQAWSTTSDRRHPLIRKRWIILAVACCVLLVFWFGGGESSQRLVGTWEVTDGHMSGATVEFTDGGKFLVRDADNDSNVTVGVYSLQNSILSVQPADKDPYYHLSEYEVEFIGDTEAILAKSKDSLTFDGFAGRWKRVGGRPGTAEENTGEVAILKAKQRDLQERRSRIGDLIDRAEADKRSVVEKLRAMGATSANTVPDTPAARRLTSELERLSGEIRSLRNDAATLDEAIAKAGSLTRRIKQADAAATDEELASLSVDLRLASDESRKATNPVELESLLDEELSGTSQ